MAEADHSSQERTLEPSARRLEQARREGQIPRSRYLAHLLVLGAAALALLLLAPAAIAGLRALLARALTFDAAALQAPLPLRLAEVVAQAAWTAAPILLLLALAALAAPLAVGGWLFAPQLAAPKFERLDPLAGVKRMFSPAAAVELAKVLLVAVLLAVVGFGYVAARLPEFAALAQQDLASALRHAGWLALLAFAALVATVAAAAAIDVPYQILQYRRRLRMTPEEARREQKESEGDPHLKARIRSAQREIARRRMMAAVPKADVVVTNPTHFAVALKYLEGRHRAPVVVAKGADALAQKIRDLAREHAVPQLEAPALARALYRHVQVGEEIPAALYAAVAQVLAYVYQLRRYAAGAGQRPQPPVDLAVPAELDPLAPRATA